MFRQLTTAIFVLLHVKNALSAPVPRAFEAIQARSSSGHIAAHDSTGNLLGYLSSQLNSGGGFQLASDPSEAASVALPDGYVPGSGGLTNITLLDSEFNLYNNLAVVEVYPTSSFGDIGPSTSNNYLILSAAIPSPEGAEATYTGTTFAAGSFGVSGRTETYVWTINADSTITASFVNDDGTLASPVQAAYFIPLQNLPKYIWFTNDQDYYEKSYGTEWTPIVLSYVSA